MQKRIDINFMKRKIRILVVTYLPWSNDISVGNTLTNIFHGMEDRLEFANVYFREDNPNNDIVTRFFNISEKQLAKSIYNRKVVGQEVHPKENSQKKSFSNRYNKARSMRWDSMLLAQDLIGLLGKWKSKSLNEFIESFHPDLVFGPLGRVPVSNNLMRYVSITYDIPLITYPWDDHYSLKKVAFSPFFWIKTFVERYAIKKCARQSKYLYGITHTMCEEYSRYFHKDIKILYKGYDFEEMPEVKPPVIPLKFIYMGNLGSGRWQILGRMAEAINEINKNGKKAEMFVYSMSPKTETMVKTLEHGDSHLMPSVDNKDVLSTMKSADVLVHVEPTTLKDRLFFRLSFSTKLVDYFYNARCILALGGKTGSIRYLQDNNAAIVETDVRKIKEQIERLVNHPNLVKEYAEKAWKCGLRNHQIKTIQDGIYSDFCNVIQKTNEHK